MDEGEKVVGFLFPADEESSGAVGPRVMPLDDPATGAGVSSMRPLGIFAFAGNVNDVTSASSHLTNGVEEPLLNIR